MAYFSSHPNPILCPRLPKATEASPFPRIQHRGLDWRAPTIISWPAHEPRKGMV